MSKKIVFDFQLDGHNLEYIHHLYIGATKDVENDYVFALPYEFKEESKVLQWPESSNITFEYFDIQKIFMKSDIYTSLKSCIYLRELLKITQADEIILIWMMNVIPFLPFYIPSKIKVSGIIYRIYLYTWKQSSFRSKLENLIKYFVLSYSRCISKVYILNDMGSANILNRVWHTNKYKYLADPYIGFSSDDVKNVRQELNIPEKNIVCLHPGAMSLRKGTMKIIEMIENASAEELSPYTFIFAGCVGKDIKDDFYKRVSLLKEKAHIIVKDAFLPFEEIGSLVYSSDKILLPYNLVDMSSGSIAYAAQFRKPVYVPCTGLLSKLVKRYKIGKTIKDFSNIEYLKDTININSNYCKDHTVNIFINQILH